LATPDDVQGLRNAVEYALHHDVVVVAAAGNDLPQGGDDANDGAGPFYPAAYPGVLAVGAVGPGGVLAGFSDRYTPVGVTAPGVNVTSAYPGTFPAAYDAVQNGTSFAAAFVSGVVALVRSAHPGLNAAQVVARIEATAHGATGPGTGHGLVDPVRAVTAVLPAEQPRAAQTARAAPSGGSTRTVALAAIAGAVGADVQLDPVRDLQPGVPAGLLYDPHHVARGALGREVRGHPQVQRDQSGVAGQRRRRIRVGRGQLELVLAGLQHDAGRLD